MSLAIGKSFLSSAFSSHSGTIFVLSNFKVAFLPSAFILEACIHLSHSTDIEILFTSILASNIAYYGPKLQILVTRVSNVSSVGAVRNRSSGRVRNALRAFRKAESLRHMKNIEGRINHTALVEEQRAGKIERRAERARLHSELLEQHKAAKNERLATSGPTTLDKEREQLKVEKKHQRTARRAAARAVIREANQKIADMLSNRRTESL